VRIPTLPHVSLVLADVAAERARQDDKWGEQDHPDGTGAFKPEADAARERCERLFASGHPMWWPILLEEVYEALAEEAPIKLREELIPVAAVAVAWVEAIDRRASRA
jgi:hypothetical protein